MTTEKIFNVGNTIVEVVKKHGSEILSSTKKNNQMILDIHRPENFKDPTRLQAIFDWAEQLSLEFDVPCLSLMFPRTYSYIEKYGINTRGTRVVDLMSYKDYLSSVYDSLFIISDSGTAQEEPAMLNTPVLVPREYTERPQSYAAMCSCYLPLGTLDAAPIVDFIQNSPNSMTTDWLGSGKTSQDILKNLMVDWQNDGN